MHCSFSKQYSFLKEIGQTPNTQVLLVQKKKPKSKKKQNPSKESDSTQPPPSKQIKHF
jgi:hypothetical protein